MGIVVIIFLESMAFAEGLPPFRVRKTRLESGLGPPARLTVPRIGSAYFVGYRPFPAWFSPVNASCFLARYLLEPSAGRLFFIIIIHIIVLWTSWYNEGFCTARPPGMSSKGSRLLL